jgi:nitroreductase
MKKLDVASWLFLGLAVFGLVLGIEQTLGHGTNENWPAHARTTAVVGGLHIVALALVTGIMAGGLRRRRRSAWITLSIVTTIGWAAWPIARVLVGDPQSAWEQIATTLALAVAVVGLGISFRSIFDADSPASSRRSAPPIGE